MKLNLDKTQKKMKHQNCVCEMTNKEMAMLKWAFVIVPRKNGPLWKELEMTTHVI
jgi:hypothetical protein